MYERELPAAVRAHATLCAQVPVNLDGDTSGTAAPHGYDGAAADAWAVGATLLAALVGTDVFCELWRPRNGWLESGSERALARARSHAHVTAMYAEPPAGAGTADAPPAEEPEYVVVDEIDERVAQLALPPLREYTEADAVGEAEHARRRALARALTEITWECLELEPTARMRIDSTLAERADALFRSASPPLGAWLPPPRTQYDEDDDRHVDGDGPPTTAALRIPRAPVVPVHAPAAGAPAELHRRRDAYPHGDPLF